MCFFAIMWAFPLQLGCLFWKNQAYPPPLVQTVRRGCGSCLIIIIAFQFPSKNGIVPKMHFLWILYCRCFKKVRSFILISKMWLYLNDKLLPKKSKYKNIKIGIRRIVPLKAVFFKYLSEKLSYHWDILNIYFLSQHQILYFMPNITFF
jgi:hypothetical protein